MRKRHLITPEARMKNKPDGCDHKTNYENIVFWSSRVEGGVAAAARPVKKVKTPSETWQ